MNYFSSKFGASFLVCIDYFRGSNFLPPNIQKLFTVSKTSTYGMLIPKIFSSEISAIIEISINSALHTIIEYQIFCVISPIVETNLGQNSKKRLRWILLRFTCQSYNHATNLFGYNGVPTKRTMLLLEEISEMHGVFIMAVC